MIGPHSHQFYINGEWSAAEHETLLPVVNPATEQTIGSIALGTKRDVERAVSSANRAFEHFAQTSKAERLELLRRILAIYRRRQREFADIMTAEMGAPIDMSLAQQAAAGVGHLLALIDSLEQFEFNHVLANGDVVFREAIGVCGLITPWNWPINQIALKVLPALACGCSMILKPSELTPYSAMLFAEVLDEAGVPAGVFNLINGEGPVVGAALSTHPEVDMMSFTGSTRAGVCVSKDAASTIKRVTLELGGKSPNIIFADVDLQQTVSDGVAACFANTGQSCDAPTRMLVEQSVYREAVEIARCVCELQKVDEPTKSGDHLGPLASQTQYLHVQSMIQQGLDEGATLVTGGLGRPDHLNVGFYAKPTVFADVTNDMQIAQLEIFGPVLVMIPFNDEHDAIEIANDTRYGLSAYLHTSDLARASRVARKLRAGMVNINGAYQQYGSPFGGYKMSGNGREGSNYGLEDFLEIKVVTPING